MDLLSILQQLNDFDTPLLANVWRRLRPLPQPNRGCSAVALDDRHIYILGGYTASQQEAAGKPPDFGFSPAVLVYDIAADRYHNATSLPVALMGIDFFVMGDALLGAGGEDRLRGRSPRTLVGRLETGR